MHYSDKIIELLLKHTRSEKLKWHKDRVQFKETTMVVEWSDLDHPLLTIICDDDKSHIFKGNLVDQLYEEVLQQQFFEGAGGDLLDELAKL